jgi:adenylyltransferase/sulfurtransferase
MTEFSHQEYLRYTRHIQLSSIGVNGQSKLKKSHVLIVGCGGLGAPVSLYLAAAGVGCITLIDGDVVELSNLQRQITFSENDIGKSKAECTQQRLQSLNSDIHITAINQPLSPDNAEALIKAADLVLDCTDNFATRYLVNDLCKLNNTAWIYASVYQSSGQCALFTPDQSCFRCLFPNPPLDALDCNSAGVLGVLPGLLGTLQATEALKVLAGTPSAISNTLLLVEADDMHFQKMALQQDKNCDCCNNDSFAFDPLSSHYQIQDVSSDVYMYSIAAADFKEWSKRDDVLLIDVRDKNENAAFNLGGEHIPLHQLSSSTSASLESIASLDKNKTIILYCQSGVRSQQACQLLRDQNIEAFSVAGGIAQIIRY